MTGYNKSLHRFSVFTACCTFCLIIAGGLVTSTQSGLSVPDWPNTYGHFMFSFPLDQMVGGIFFEHTHRLVASFVGFLTIILAVWLWLKEDRKWVRNLGVIALVSVIIQGILGGLTVRYLLPTPISVAHATLAQTFFAITVSLALFTSRWWRESQPSVRFEQEKFSVSKVSLFATIAIFLQLIIGAWMRHSDAGLAVPDFPLAYGQVIPSLSQESVEQYNKHLEELGIRIFADDKITASQITIHLLHRVWACVVTIMVGWTIFRLRKTAINNKRLTFFVYWLGGLILIQLTLGMFTVLSQKAIDITTAHVATGALLLVSSVLTTLHVVKLFGFSHASETVKLTGKEVTA